MKWLKAWWSWRRRRPNAMPDGRYYPGSWDMFYDRYSLWKLERPQLRRRRR